MGHEKFEAIYHACDPAETYLCASRTNRPNRYAQHACQNLIKSLLIVRESMLFPTRRTNGKKIKHQPRRSMGAAGPRKTRFAKDEHRPACAEY